MDTPTTDTSLARSRCLTAATRSPCAGLRLLRPRDLAWLAARKDLPHANAQVSDCMIINTWAADSAVVNRILLDAARQAARGTRFVCFKRFYSNGSVRRMRNALQQACRRRPRSWLKPSSTLATE